MALVVLLGSICNRLYLPRGGLSIPCSFLVYLWASRSSSSAPQSSGAEISCRDATLIGNAQTCPRAPAVFVDMFETSQTHTEIRHRDDVSARGAPVG